MKKITFILFLLITISTAFSQNRDTISRKTILQLGYVYEYVDGGGAGLNGFEGQVKLLLKKQRLAKGEKLKDALYINAGYTYFPSTAYSLGQLNAGIGFRTPILKNLLNIDFGLGAAYYHGTVGEKSWVGKTADLGFHFGIDVPIGRVAGVYVKYWAPGGTSSLSDDNYVSPMFITAGFQF